MNTLNTEFRLSSRIKLEQIENDHIGIVKKVKSRIIKKDALKIIEIADTIRKHKPYLRISLICNNNICSKSVDLLNENSIAVHF